MKTFDLINELIAIKVNYDSALDFNPEVVLIVNGITYPIDQVWFEPKQNEVGAICLGDDPR